VGNEALRSPRKSVRKRRKMRKRRKSQDKRKHYSQVDEDLLRPLII